MIEQKDQELQNVVKQYTEAHDETLKLFDQKQQNLAKLTQLKSALQKAVADNAEYEHAYNACTNAFKLK